MRKRDKRVVRSVLAALMLCSALLNVFAEIPSLAISAEGTIDLDGVAIAQVASRTEPLPASNGYIPPGVRANINLVIGKHKYRLVDPWADLAKANARRNTADWVPLVEIDVEGGRCILVYGNGPLSKEDCRDKGASEIQITLRVPMDSCDLLRFAVVERVGTSHVEHIYSYNPCSRQLVLLDRWLRAGGDK